MVGNCWKCGAPFRFDESKVRPRAVVRCPACQERNLLTADPSAPEPTFYITPLTQAAAQAAADAAPPSAPKPPEPLEPPPLLPPLGGAFEEAASPQPQAPRTTHVRPAQGPIDLGGDDAPTLELDMKPKGGQNVAPEPRRAPRPFTPQSRPPGTPPPPTPRKTISQTQEALQRRVTASSPSVSQAPTLKPKLASRLLTLFLLVIALGGLGYGGYLFFGGNKGAETKLDPAKEAANKRGLAILAELRAKYPKASAEEHAQQVKEAEDAFRRDLPAHYEQARNLFVRALVDEPGNAELLARYAESCARSSEWPQTLGEARALVDLVDYGLLQNPDFAALHRAKARIFMALGESAKALAEAELARKLEPEQPENLVCWGEALIPGNPARAVEILNGELEGGKGPIIAIAPLARAHIALGDYAKAEAVLKLRDTLDPQSCALCDKLGRLYEDLGLVKEAQDVYKRLSLSHPETVAGDLGLARLDWQEKGDPRSALKRLELSPSRINGLSTMEKGALNNSLARYALFSKDFTLAKISAQRAYETDPKPIGTRYHYALALINSDSLERQTLETLLEGLSLDAPREPDVLMLRGLYAKASGDLNAAVGFFNDAIAVDGAYFHAQLMLASLYLDAPNIPKAFERFNALLAYPPTIWDDHPARDDTTPMFRYEDTLQKRIDALGEAEVDSDRKFMAKGLALTFARQYAEAKRAFEKVLANQSDHEKANLYLALIAQKLHAPALVRQHLAKVWEHDRAHSCAAEIYVRQLISENKRGEARKFLDRIMSTEHNDARLFALASELALDAKDVEGAQRLAGKALGIDPGSLMARRARYFATK